MLNKKYISYLANIFSPRAEVVSYDQERYSVLSLIKCTNIKVLELGVAEGEFCLALLEKYHNIIEYHGIDNYDYPSGQIHFKNLIEKTKNLDVFSLHKIDFFTALDRFDDNYFDIIYIDGFAHDGHLGGSVARKWLKKLKPGGILAGDDYHLDWPLVKWYVNIISNITGSPINLLTNTLDTKYSEYPTWFFKIPNSNETFKFPLLLKLLSWIEGTRIKLRKTNFVRHLISQKNNFTNKN